MKVIETKEYVSILRELTEENKEVSMRIAGNSMLPFLVHERDVIYFKKIDRSLKRGDMVFFQRKNGQYVMHRICKIKPEGYYIVGDAQVVIEGPVEEEQIFAIISKVCRKGKWIGPGNLCWEFYEHVWLWLLPVRCYLMRIYRGVARRIR